MLGRVGEHRGHAVGPGEGDVAGIDETAIAHVQHMAQRPPARLARQQVEERGEGVAVDADAGVELPDQGGQPVVEFGDAADEILDLGAGGLQGARLGDALGCLGGEHEARRRLVAPLRIGGRLLCAVVGAVDLDRRQLPAGVFQLAPLHQAARIEVGAPGRIRPAADADADAVDRRNARVGQVEAGAGGRLARAHASAAQGS